MPELIFDHPNLPDQPYLVVVPEGQDTTGVVASMADSGWELRATPETEAAPVEVPVGDPINLTPETPADQGGPAEPETTDQPAPADDLKE